MVLAEYCLLLRTRVLVWLLPPKQRFGCRAVDSIVEHVVGLASCTQQSSGVAGGLNDPGCCVIDGLGPAERRSHAHAKISRTTRCIACLRELIQRFSRLNQGLTRAGVPKHRQA
jgi:hypothetical protein